MMQSYYVLISQLEQIACLLTPLFMAASLVAFAIVFNITDLERRKQFLYIILYLFTGATSLHWLHVVDFGTECCNTKCCNQNLTTHTFKHPLNEFSVVPFCAHVFSLFVVRWIIEWLHVAKPNWHKTILFFVVLEFLIILYLYYSFRIVATLPCLQLNLGVPLPFGTLWLKDFLYVDLILYVLRAWFVYCVWRVKFIPNDTNIQSQDFVWIFIVAVSISFSFIDLFIPPTQLHAGFFMFMVLLALFEYLFLSKPHYPTQQSSACWFYLSALFLYTYLYIQ